MNHDKQPYVICITSSDTKNIYKNIPRCRTTSSTDKLHICAIADCTNCSVSYRLLCSSVLYFKHYIVQHATFTKTRRVLYENKAQVDDMYIHIYRNNSLQQELLTTTSSVARIVISPFPWWYLNTNRTFWAFSSIRGCNCLATSSWLSYWKLIITRIEWNNTRSAGQKIDVRWSK